MRATLIPTAAALLMISTHAAAVTRTVDTLSDVTNSIDGLTTLREAVAASDAGDEIDFAPAVSNGTIILEQGQITLAKSITISGPFLGRPIITTPKANPTRLFLVPDGIAPTLSRLILTGGHADDGGAIKSEGNLTITGCRFEDNTATGDGGAINHEKLTLTLRDCIFVGNSAQAGGAISNDVNAFLSAEDCEFETNTSTSPQGTIAAGGALRSRGSGAALIRCRFVGNISDGGGAAVAAISGGMLSAQNCEFIGNTELTSSGPGAVAVALTGVSSSFSNCVFAGNNSVALRLQTHDVTAFLKNCTFSGHYQGAITAFNHDLSLTNCIIWGNRFGGSTFQPETSLGLSGDSTLSASHSLLQNWNLTGDGVGNLDGTDNENDPRFVSPFDPLPSPQEDGDLTPGLFSSVVNTGDSTGAIGNTDVAGNPRLVSAEVDLGAYEVQQKSIYVDASSVADPADGATWATAFQTLGDALDTAAPGDVIGIAEGIYRPDQGTGRVAGDPSEAFEINFPLTILGGFESGGGPRDLILNRTIISGDIDDNDATNGDITRSWEAINGSNSANLFALTLGPFGEILLDGLVLTAADGTGGAAFETGAIKTEGRTATLIDCQFLGNRKALAGRDSTVTVRRCEFKRNSGGQGSVINFFRSNVSYVNTLFTANTDHIEHDEGIMSATNVEVSGNQFGFRLITDATAEFINVTAAGNRNVPFLLYGTAHADFTNSIIWNNSRTQSPNASIRMFDTSTASFSHCIVQHHDLRGEGQGNFDGTDPITNPGFLRPQPSQDAPQEGGNYWLSENSPAEDAGDNSANPELIDLSGNPRVRKGIINLGATESTFAPNDDDGDRLPDWWEFEHSDPHNIEAFEPMADDDGDGLVNIAEFVHGLDPLTPNPTSDYMRHQLVESNGDQYFALVFRLAPVARVEFNTFVEHSTDLGTQDPWSTEDVFPVFTDGSNFEQIQRSREPFGTLPTEFLRLKISQKIVIPIDFAQ